MLFFCLLVICGGAFSSPIANQYMDNILHSALQNTIRSEKIDPTFLPDYTFDYKDKTFFGNVKGHAEYTEGSLSGLSQIVRIGECQGPSNVAGATLINCTLAFNRLNTAYKGKVKYGVIPKVSINAKGNTSNVLTNLVIAKAFNERQAKVRSLTLRQFNRINTEFTGLGPLNKHMKVLEENYKDRVGQEVVNIILNRFQYVLNLAVAQVPMPLH